MNLNPDALRSKFLNFHQRITRHTKNKDKALIDGRDRFYLSPTKWEWARRERGMSKYVEPDPKTAWEIILYNMTIVRVQPDASFTLNTGGWNSNITREYIARATGFHFQRKRFNQWTPSALLIHYASGVCLFVDGMKFVEGKPVNPKQPKVFKPDFTHPEVKEVRKKLKEIRERYLPLAQLHATTSKGVDPFEGVKYVNLLWEELIEETEAKAETYAALVRNGFRKYWEFDPVNALTRSLEGLKKEQYRRYLVEVK